MPRPRTAGTATTRDPAVHAQQWHGTVAVPSSLGLHSSGLTGHTVALTGSEGPVVPAADPRYPIGCAAVPADAGPEGSVGSPCAAVRRLSAGCAWRRRHSGDRFRPDIDRPAERRHPPCLGAETPAGSCRRSVRVHQPWLSAPRVSLAANLVAWHSTPNSTAPRSHPASPEHAAAHGSEEAAATAQCRPAHFGSLVDLLLRPLNHCADLQPPRPRPHGSAAACSRGTRKSAPSCAHNPDFKVDLIHFRSRSSGLAGS